MPDGLNRLLYDSEAQAAYVHLDEDYKGERVCDEIVADQVIVDRTPDGADRGYRTTERWAVSMSDSVMLCDAHGYFSVMEILRLGDDEYDPCGECRKGECDDCELCRVFKDPPWRIRGDVTHA